VEVTVDKGNERLVWKIRREKIPVRIAGFPPGLDLLALVLLGRFCVSRAGQVELWFLVAYRGSQLAYIHTKPMGC